MAMTSKKTQPLDIKQLAYWFFSFRAKSMILWESLVELISEVPDFKSHLEIKLIGSVRKF
jgi:hypothetical protein